MTMTFPAPDLGATPVATFHAQTPCHFAIVSRMSLGFVDYVPVCTAHAWIGAECGTLEAAHQQPCLIAVEHGIAYGRVRWLLREGFSVVTELQTASAQYARVMSR